MHTISRPPVSLESSPQLARIPRRRYGTVVGDWILRALDRLVLWQERAAGRHQLAQMSDRDLKDMGISRAEANWEARKPFWRI